MIADLIKSFLFFLIRAYPLNPRRPAYYSVFSLSANALRNLSILGWITIRQ
jgi:hypothetical protein